MFSQILAALAAFTVIATQSAGGFPSAYTTTQTLSEKEYSLSDRYANTYVNDVFADNILLTLAYMRGVTKDGQAVDWNKVKEDFSYTMVMKPGETFAFHDAILPQYKHTTLETTNAHFDYSEGFKSDGWLVGDGVCHLASFMNVVARDAKLQVDSPTLHDFAAIPDVPKEYGVAIYYSPNSPEGSSLQNLYITNTFSMPVAFIFTYKENKLDIKVEKLG